MKDENGQDLEKEDNISLNETTEKDSPRGTLSKADADLINSRRNFSQQHSNTIEHGMEAIPPTPETINFNSQNFRKLVPEEKEICCKTEMQKFSDQIKEPKLGDIQCFLRSLIPAIDPVYPKKKEADKKESISFSITSEYDLSHARATLEFFEHFQIKIKKAQKNLKKHENQYKCLEIANSVCKKIIKECQDYLIYAERIILSAPGGFWNRLYRTFPRAFGIKPPKTFSNHKSNDSILASDGEQSPVKQKETQEEIKETPENTLKKDSVLKEKVNVQNLSVVSEQRKSPALDSDNANVGCFTIIGREIVGFFRRKKSPTSGPEVSNMQQREGANPNASSTLGISNM